MRADTTVALLVFLCLAAAAAVLAAPAVASHGDDANFTVQPEDREPNVSGATYETWVVTERSYEDITRFQYRLPEGAFWDCADDDLDVFGIDRGGDDDGLETDERPPAQYTSFDESVFLYQVDGTVDLAAGDEIVASVSNCLYNPEEEGWYKGQVFLTDENDNAPLQTESHYYWICDCEDEAEARERLGPPPSENSTTPTPTPTQEPVVTDEPTPEPTATATAGPTPTESAPETATATADPGDDDTATPTGTDPGTDEPASTPTPTATGTASPEVTVTEGADESEPAQPAEETETTPGSGPGFGLVVAVLALIAVALLVRRRG